MVIYIESLKLNCYTDNYIKITFKKNFFTAMISYIISLKKKKTHTHTHKKKTELNYPSFSMIYF